VAERVHGLEERGDFSASGDLSVGLLDSGLGVGGLLARAARRGRGSVLGNIFDVTGGLLALKLALRAGAGGGLGARPVALGLLAQGRALGLGGDASGVASGRGADGLALGAVTSLAHVLGAANRTLRLVAVNLALGTLELLALLLALRARADRVADGRALRVIALPAALRVALSLHLSGVGDGQNNQQQDSDGVCLFELIVTRSYFCRIIAERL